MSDYDVEVSIKCNKCGSPVTIDLNGPSDDAIITCQSCGASLDRLGDIKVAVEKAAIEAAVLKPLEDALKGFDGFTVKKE
ncbi:MAG: Lar family restriction alleviation protein [Pseudomonadota bacterium]|nr:Lar family restriction alleviation protein [Pseudomonadota bacterium]